VYAINSFLDWDAILGQGEFGIVYKGKVNLDNIMADAAFKTTKSTGRNNLEATRKQVKSLISELKLMIYIGRHPNLINLLGAYTRQLQEGLRN